MIAPSSQSGAKSERKYISIDWSTTNYNLANDLTNNHGWDGTSPVDVEVTVRPSTHVYATATTAPAFDVDLVAGSKLTLNNNGVISGKGGAAGSPGGHAISLKNVDATIYNAPSKNLLLRTEVFSSGSWWKVGSPTVIDEADSKNLYTNSEAVNLSNTINNIAVTTDVIAKPVPGNLQVYPVPTNSTWSKTGSATITDNYDYNPVNGVKDVPVIALGDAEQIYDNTALNGSKELTGSVYLWCGKNMMKQSQRIESGDWLKLSTVVAAPYDDVLAPDGTMTAEGVQAANNLNVQHRVYQASSTIASGTHVTGSIYVKAGAQSWVSLAVYQTAGSQGVRKFVNLATGAIGTDTSFNNPTDPHFSVEDAGNGWYRIIAGVKTTTSSTVTMTVQLTNADNVLTLSIANHASDQIYLWGGQMEIGSTATSYEPTTTVAGSDVGKTVRLYIRDATNSAWSSAKTVTLTSTPTRYSLTHTPAASAARGGVRIYGDTGVTLTTLRAYGVQLIEGSEPTALLTGPNGTGNILPHPEDFDQWTNSNGTDVNSNVLVAPDGTRTADTIERSSSAASIWTNRASIVGVVETSTLYTVSGFFKHSGSNRTIVSFINPDTPYTNISEIGVTWSANEPTVNRYFTNNATSIGTPVYQNVGNNWWRISFQVMTSATATDYRVNVFPNGGLTGNDPVGVWGMQVEKGALTDYGLPVDHTIPKTGDLVLETAATGGHRFGQGITPNQSNVAHTMSVYLKAAGRNFAYIREGFLGGGYKHTAIDLSDGSITQDSHGTAEVENVGDGWFRLSATLTPVGGSDIYIGSNNAAITDDNFVSYAGDTSKGIYAWGAQMEQSATLSAHESTGSTKNPPLASPVNGGETVRLFKRTTNAAGYMGQSHYKPAINQTFTFSIYAKRSVGDFLCLHMQGTYPNGRGNAKFNLATGEVTTPLLGSDFSNPSAQIVPVGDGWYRCSYTVTSDTRDQLAVYLTCSSNNGNIDAGDSISGSEVYLWGAQLELTNKNLYKNPEDLSGSGWAYSATITTDAATNPVDGAMTADKAQITDGSNTSTGKREQSVPLIAGQTYIHSVYMKNIDASTTRFTCWNNNGGAWLGYLSIAWASGLPGAAPTLTAHYGASNEIAEDVGNGWYRISCRLTTAAGSALHASGTLCSINSTGTGIYVYGFQMELLTADGKPSPYIPVSRNLLDYPEDTDKWGMASGGVTVVKDALVAPDGTGADTIADFGSLNHSIYQNHTLETSTQYTYSLYVKHSGTNSTRLLIADNVYAQLHRADIAWDGNGVASKGYTSFPSSDYTVTAVGNGWYRAAFSFTSDTQATHNVYVFPDRLTSGDPLGVWGLQLEKGAKNLVTHSEELDNAAWVKPAGSGVAPVVTANAYSVNINPYSENAKLNYTTVNTTTITENVAAAPDGLFTADRIEDTSPTATQYTQENINIAATSDKYTWSFYILKDSNTTRFPRFYMGLYYGSSGNQNMVCWLNTSTGAVQNGTGAYALTSVVSADAGDYWRVSLTGTNNGGNTILYTQVWPCASSSMGGGLHNHLTGSVVFAHSQVEVGATASQYEPKLTGGNYVKMLAPDGTETAEYLSTTDTANRRVYQSPGKPTLAEEYTFSIHAKKSRGDYFALRIQGAWPNRAEAIFNLETGVVEGTPHYGGATPATGATIESLPNGWFRVSITFISDDATSVSGVFAPAITSNTVGGTDSAAGAAAYVWGAQIERGPLTDYEEASNYIAVGNKSTPYQRVNIGVTTYMDRDAKIWAGGGGGGSGGSVTGHGSQVDSGEGGECTVGSSHSGGSGGTGAGSALAAATAGSSGSSPAGPGGAGGTWGQPGSSGSGGAGTAGDSQCAGQVSNGAGSAGGAAGKAIHLVSGATLNLHNGGSILGATS